MTTDANAINAAVEGERARRLAERLSSDTSAESERARERRAHLVCAAFQKALANAASLADAEAAEPANGTVFDDDRVAAEEAQQNPAAVRDALKATLDEITVQSILEFKASGAGSLVAEAVATAAACAIANIDDTVRVVITSLNPERPWPQALQVLSKPGHVINSLRRFPYAADAGRVPQDNVMAARHFLSMADICPDEDSPVPPAVRAVHAWVEIAVEYWERHCSHQQQEQQLQPPCHKAGQCNGGGVADGSIAGYQLQPPLCQSQRQLDADDDRLPPPPHRGSACAGSGDIPPPPQAPPPEGGMATGGPGPRPFSMTFQPPSRSGTESPRDTRETRTGTRMQSPGRVSGARQRQSSSSAYTPTKPAVPNGRLRPPSVASSPRGMSESSPKKAGPPPARPLSKPRHSPSPPARGKAPQTRQPPASGSCATSTREQRSRGSPSPPRSGPHHPSSGSSTPAPGFGAAASTNHNRQSFGSTGGAPAKSPQRAPPRAGTGVPPSNRHATSPRRAPSASAAKQSAESDNRGAGTGGLRSASSGRSLGGGRSQVNKAQQPPPPASSSQQLAKSGMQNHSQCQSGASSRQASPGPGSASTLAASKPRGPPAEQPAQVQEWRRLVEDQKKEIREMRAVESQILWNFRREEKQERVLEERAAVNEIRDWRWKESDEMKAYVERQDYERKILELQESKDFQEFKREFKAKLKQEDQDFIARMYLEGQENAVWKAEMTAMLKGRDQELLSNRLDDIQHLRDLRSTQRLHEKTSAEQERQFEQQLEMAHMVRELAREKEQVMESLQYARQRQRAAPSIGNSRVGLRQGV